MPHDWDEELWQQRLDEAIEEANEAEAGLDEVDARARALPRPAHGLVVVDVPREWIGWVKFWEARR